MAWVAVDKNRTGFIFTEKPERCENAWINKTNTARYVFLASDYIEWLLRRELTWDDEPVEI